MKELIDSGALAGDPESLRARLSVYGYLFFRGLLPAGPVVQAGAAVASALADDGWTDATGRPSTPPRAVNVADALRDRGFLAASATRPFNRIPYLPQLRGTVRGVLGADAFSYPVKVLRAIYPEEGAGVARGRFVHQDFIGSRVCDMLTTWVPLMPVPVRLGGLAVLPGSHLGPPLLPRTLSPDRPDQPDWATADFEVGDVLLFHCLTSHAALPNRTDRLRLSQDTRWQAADQPAPARMIYGPPAVRREGAPRELYSRLLRFERWWEPVPASLTIAAHEGGADVDAGADPNRRVHSRQQHSPQASAGPAVWSRFFAVHPAWSSAAPWRERLGKSAFVLQSGRRPAPRLAA
ncbi:MAG TPA: phytanoyl-CoA dioxygenase family protein, partial [Actinocrinis sp.]